MKLKTNTMRDTSAEKADYLELIDRGVQALKDAGLDPEKFAHEYSDLLGALDHDERHAAARADAQKAEAPREWLEKHGGVWMEERLAHGQ